MIFKPCNKNGCINGYIKKFNEELGIDIMTHCNCRTEFNSKISMEANKQRLNIPTLPENYNLDNYLGTKSLKVIQALKRYIKDFNVLESHCLYLHGQMFTQKTTVAQYIQMEIEKQDYSTKFLHFSELLDLLKYGFKPNNEDINRELIEPDYDFIVIDKFLESSNPNNNNLSTFQLGTVMQYLTYVSHKDIVFAFTTNVSQKDLMKKYPSLLSFFNSKGKFAFIEFRDNYYEELERLVK